MTANKIDEAEYIIDLLNREHTALLEADIQALDDITIEKEEWASAIPQIKSEFSSKALDKIRTISAQNASLFEATLAAQKSVIERLQEIQKAQQTLGTYSKDGLFETGHVTKVETRS